MNKKATALGCLLLESKHNKKFKYLGLLKLMYLCDREMIQYYNRPITRDRYINMKFGPVLSNVLGLIRNDMQQFDDELSHLKNNPDYNYYWANHISTNGYFVHLEKKGDAEKTLNKVEKEVISNVLKEHGNKDPFELVELLHNQEKYPEWEDPAPYGVKPLSLVKLLKTMKKDTAAISKYIFHFG